MRRRGLMSACMVVALAGVAAGCGSTDDSTAAGPSSSGSMPVATGSVPGTSPGTTGRQAPDKTTSLILTAPGGANSQQLGDAAEILIKRYEKADLWARVVRRADAIEVTVGADEVERAKALSATGRLQIRPVLNELPCPTPASCQADETGTDDAALRRPARFPGSKDDDRLAATGFVTGSDDRGPSRGDASRGRAL